MSRVALYRVVLLQDVDTPLNMRGGRPGLQKVYLQEPTGPKSANGIPTRRAQYDLWEENGRILIVDRDSGHEERVPMNLVRQYQTLENYQASVKKGEPARPGVQLP